MKKAGLWMALLLVLLAGCSSKTPKIDAYSWVMTSVQSMDAGGQAVAYGERGSSTLEGAKQVELICEAKDGTLTLTDQTNDRTYAGTYRGGPGFRRPQGGSTSSFSASNDQMLSSVA